MRNDYPQKIEDLKVGDNVCHIFEREEDRNAIVIPFISTGLERREKILYIAGTDPEQIQEALIKRGLDVSAYIKSGQISIIARDMISGSICFDADGIVSFIQEETDAALAEGYFALRIVNDMNWACSLQDFEQLVEQLTFVNKSIFNSKCLVLCQFDRRRFLPIMLQSILHVYLIAIIDREIYENHCSLPPDAFQHSDLSELKLNNLISLLKERKRLEKALQEEKCRSRVILDNFSQVAFMHDRDLRYTWVYDPSKKLGLSEEEIVGRTDLEVTPFDEPHRLTEIKRAVLKSGMEAREEVRITRNGAVTFCDLTVEPLQDDKGEVSGIACVAVDITKAKQAEREMGIQAQMLDSVEQAVIAANADGKINYWNYAAELFYGWSLKEALGRSILEIISDESYTTQAEEIMSCLKCGRRWSGEFTFKHKDGNVFRVMITDIPILDEHGRLDGIISVSTDTTKRRLMEAQLSAENALCRAIIEQAVEGLCVSHEVSEYPFLQFTVWNDKMKEITGYTREEINHLGWQQSLYVDPEQQKGSAERLARVRSGQKLTGEEWEITRKDGRKRVLSVYTTFLNLGDGPVYILGMIHDITEKKRAEEALKGYSEHLEALVEERTEQLKNAERLAAIGETAAMIGHDLRNPLQALFCMVYLAKERLNSCNISTLEAQLSLEDILDSIEESADYMNKIVSDIQDYAQTLSLNLVKTDISYFIRDTLSTINIPDNVHITIQVEEKPLEFNIDLEKMKRVIINLVTNSLNAMPEGGHISICVSACQDGDLARISVKDTGVGIPEEVLPKLFLPLFTTRSKGMGLGLSVCKRMVDAMGGNIVINSRVGEGTEAIIEIPMRQDNG